VLLNFFIANDSLIPVIIIFGEDTIEDVV